jgi:hypothetical protein
MARSDDVEDWIPASFDDDFNPAAHGWLVEKSAQLRRTPRGAR